MKFLLTNCLIFVAYAGPRGRVQNQVTLTSDILENDLPKVTNRSMHFSRRRPRRLPCWKKRKSDPRIECQSANSRLYKPSGCNSYGCWCVNAISGTPRRTCRSYTSSFTSSSSTRRKPNREISDLNGQWEALERQFQLPNHDTSVRHAFATQRDDLVFDFGSLDTAKPSPCWKKREQDLAKLLTDDKINIEITKCQKGNPNLYQRRVCYRGSCKCFDENTGKMTSKRYCMPQRKPTSQPLLDSYSAVENDRIEPQKPGNKPCWEQRSEDLEKIKNENLSDYSVAQCEPTNENLYQISVCDAFRCYCVDAFSGEEKDDSYCNALSF